MGAEKKQMNSLPCLRNDRNALRRGYIKYDNRHPMNYSRTVRVEPSAHDLSAINEL
jgi:hypothetical protein